MGRKSKYTITQKVDAVLDYKNGKRSMAQIDLGLNASGVDLYKWVMIYDKNGELGFLPKKRNKSYTKEFKDTVVKAYLKGEGSYNDLAFTYEIPSSTT